MILKKTGYFSVYSGMTLIELLCCMGILIVLMSLTLPAGYQALLKYRVESVVDDIQAAVRFARLVAYTEGQAYQLIPAESWSQGMTLAGQGKAPIRVWTWKNRAVQVSWQGFESTRRLVFSPDPLYARSNGQFVVESGKMKKRVIVNRLGRVTLK